MSRFGPEYRGPPGSVKPPRTRPRRLSGSTERQGSQPHSARASPRGASPHSPRSPRSPRPGTASPTAHVPIVGAPYKQWQVDPQGNIVNFSLRELREDTLLRLKRAEQLYTLEECKILLREVLKQMAAAAEVELADLIYLTKLRDRLFPGRPVEYTVPPLKIPDLGFGPDLEGPLQFQLGRVVEEVNKSIVRMIDTFLAERRDRLLMAARILQEIEEVA
eukprot:TRINITY_DN21594_c0_g1_i1.p1 TRINITY_DN21594_c0_g1~~TRINITY_DN21594_c0_g1_i1.p1  ORF type:complete len:219 (+),score=31.60 TRINITY_DN21594_c0_g1_i1:72-728(+)